jgi:hypothetical protein
MKTVAAVATFVLMLFALISAFYAFNAYVDNRIKKQVTDPVFMREIAAALRPTVIFDSENRILADQGGLNTKSL